jgi:hypothetical protein
LRLRNIGGMVIVDFIDMDSRKDQQQVLEVFQRVLEEDRAKPQVGQLSDLGLVELTRRRQGQSLRELFTVHCTGCSGLGVVPTLELGTAEHRRVISFKSPEETTKTRGGNNRRPLRQQNAGGGQLRAATAHNGRILPTVDEAEEEDFTDVPEEILDQMPDDLLADPAERELKGGVKRAAYNESESEDEEDNDQAQFDAHNEDFAPKANLFEESFSDDEEEESSTLTENITAVEHVFNEMGARPGQETPAEQIAAEASEVRPYEQAEPYVHAEPEESSPDEQPEVAVESETEEDLVSFADSSPFQTEYDPVTGTYRLKARVVESESQQEGASQHSEHHDHGHSHEHEHEHSHEHNGEHAHQHEHGHNEHEHSHEHGHDHSHEHGHEQHGHESGSNSMQGEQLNLFGANEQEDTSGSHQAEAQTWNDTTGDASEGGQEERSEQHEQSVYSGSQQWGEDNG